MKNHFTLNIKTPCLENYNQFTKTQNGGFCSSCKKEVIDFTTMNTKEINNYFNTENTQNTCGKFNNHQLNTFKEKPQQNLKLKFARTIGIAACLSLFTMTTAFAQDDKSDTTTEVSQQQEFFIVKGNVTDDNEALPGVNIVLQGTAIGTQTDFDGDFEFPQKLKKGDVLVFSYVGLESQKIVIENKDSASNVAININMKLDTVVIMGKVATKGVFKSNRSK